MNATFATTKQSTAPFWRSLIVLGLVGLTVGVCFLGTPPVEKSESPVNLNLPDGVGPYWGTKQPISDAELFLLPKDTEFAKKVFSNGTGNDISCQIVLAGSEKRSIHRPEVCLPAQGWTLKSGEVVPVKLDNGKILEVMKLTVARPVTMKNGEQKELTSLFCYWFVGKNTTTPHHFVRVLKTNFDLLLHNTNHRWAYVVVSAPVLEGFVPGGKSQAQVMASVERFIAEVAPQIIKAPAGS